MRVLIAVLGVLLLVAAAARASLNPVSAGLVRFPRPLTRAASTSECTNHDVATKRGHRLLSGAPRLYSDHSTMTHEKDNHDRQAAASAKETRQNRLKLALRENLKRRKSQARGRGEGAGTSSETTEASLDDADEKSRTSRK